MRIPDLQKQIATLYVWSQNGCGNHGCRIKKPVGMGTNSTCSCNPDAFKTALWSMLLALDKDHPSKYSSFDV